LDRGTHEKGSHSSPCPSRIASNWLHGFP
jgi:hypothetical protein